MQDWVFRLGGGTFFAASYSKTALQTVQCRKWPSLLCHSCLLACLMSVPLGGNNIVNYYHNFGNLHKLIDTIKPQQEDFNW